MNDRNAGVLAGQGPAAAAPRRARVLELRPFSALIPRSARDHPLQTLAMSASRANAQGPLSGRGPTLAFDP
jgi:hypothetical protein